MLMKKAVIIFCSIAACISCSKTEVVYDQTEEITLLAVNENMTKSMMSGNDFKGESFNVWAWYKPLGASTTIEKWMGDHAEQQLYIDEKPFVQKTSPYWGGQAQYFWPKQGSLMLAGYYAPNLNDENAVTYQFDATNNKMVFSGVEPGKVVKPTKNDDKEVHTYDEDIMYFNMTPASIAYSQAAPVVTFKHALSWITVTLKKRTNPEINANIIVHEVSFSDIYTKGDGTVIGTSDIAWEKSADVTEGVYYVTEDKDTSTEEHDSEIEMTTTENTLDEPLFIPQTMENKKLKVVYSVVSTDNSTFTETYEIKLSDLKYREDNETVATKKASSWDAGKHYTYAITIGTEEILVTPTVSPWEPIIYPVDIPIPENEQEENNKQ